MRLRILVWLIPLLLAAGLAVSWHQGWLKPPPAYDPFAPLHLQDRPTFVTSFKLMRLSQPAYCRAALATARLETIAIPDHETRDGCRLENTVRVTATGSETGLRFNASFLASCPLAVAYGMFERHALQPLAQKHFGQEVRELHHLGSYACRNVRGQEGRTARRSEHATANALDLAAVTLVDGRRISLSGHWRDRQAAANNPEALFLRELRDGACRFFRTVLGPDYNAAHADHLHLDMGGFNICR